MFFLDQHGTVSPVTNIIKHFAGFCANSRHVINTDPLTTTVSMLLKQDKGYMFLLVYRIPFTVPWAAVHVVMYVLDGLIVVRTIYMFNENVIYFTG